MDKLRIKSRTEIEKMKRSGHAAATVLKRIGEAIVPGVSTAELERISRAAIAEHNAISSFLGYQLPEHEPYPATICTSINDVVIHGIPDESHVLKDGDIIGIDTAVSINGYHGDNAFTFPVGRHLTLSGAAVESDTQFALCCDCRSETRKPCRRHLCPIATGCGIPRVLCTPEFFWARHRTKPP